MSLLGLTAAAAGSFAFVDGDVTFTVIFMLMSGFALGHVFRGAAAPIGHRCMHPGRFRRSQPRGAFHLGGPTEER
jgi:hypothetical protein